MAWAKRILLFIAVNFLVMLTISLVVNLLGLQRGLYSYGIDYPQLMAFCLVWGMTGSVISLALSRVMAKSMMGVQVIDPASASGVERDLVNMVHNLARGAKLPAMPEVGIYDSPELNAFATGPTRSRALVAVSSGLLRRMDRAQVEGVLGHEIAHVSNGDMVTMTLVQGVINAFVLFFARVIAYALSQNARDENRHAMQYMTSMVLEIVFSVLGMIAVAAFSRMREFRADRGGAQLAGREKMIAALQALAGGLDRVDNRQAALAAFKISGRPGGFMALLSTHPPLEERIRRLQEYR